MRLRWDIFYVFLFVYRSAYSYLAQVVLTRFTTLGDSDAFQGAGASLLEGPLEDQRVDLVEGNRVLATELTDLIGALFHRLFGGEPVLINIGFQSIGFAGIVLVLRAAEGRARLLLAALFLFPSFTIWSSVAGKEAIVVLAIGVVSAAIIRLSRGERGLGLLFVVCLMVIYLFKNHYIPAIAFALVGLVVVRRVEQKAAVVLIGTMISLFLLYLFRDRVDELAFSIIPHFLGLGSSREAFWIAQYDVFFRAPMGMLLGFAGPTFSEAASNQLMLVSLVESAVLIVVLVAYTVPKLPRMSVAMALLGGMAVFWILFASYPLGVLNPGSAIRYRTGFEVFVFAIVICVMGKYALKRRQQRIAQPKKLAAEGSSQIVKSDA